MSTLSDLELGQRLRQWIQEAGDSALKGGVLNQRLQGQLLDLLGADTTLLPPIRDLLQRPAFHQLFHGSSQGQSLMARDALLRDLAEMYSPQLMHRLDGVLQGCLNLPGASTAPFTAQTGTTSAYRSAPPAAASIPIPDIAAKGATIQQPQQQGSAAVVITLLALMCGGLVMTLAGVLVVNRYIPSTDQQPPSNGGDPIPYPEQNGQWQACVDYASNDGLPPQPGETWWPVVGPIAALDAARRNCRADAFKNTSGNAQIASFRNQGTARAFTQQLNSDSSHGFSFWLGDPTPF